MKITSVTCMLLVSNAWAFSPQSRVSNIPSIGIVGSHHGNAVTFTRTQLSSTTDAPSDVESMPSDDIEPSSAPLLTARNDLLRTAQKLTKKSPTGVFLALPTDRAEFIKAVARLEAIAPTTSDESEKLCLGDWTLLATSKRTPLGKNMDDSLDSKKALKLPKLDAATKLQESIVVTQRIRSSEEDDNPIIDRVDNVIEFDNTMTNFLPAALNPLQVDKSKTVLVHKAKVESFVPFRINMSLSSVVLNVAGQSKQLDPEGADIFGLNVPSLSDWMNSGGFDTTYVDDDVRISRGTIGFLEETRVFVRQGCDLSDIMAGIDEVEEDPTQLDKIASAVGDVASAVGGLRKDVKETIERDAEVVRGDIETAVQDVKDVVEEDLKDVSEAVVKVKSAVIGDEEVETAVDNVASAVGDLGKDVVETVESAVNEIKTKVEDDTKKIQEAVEDVKEIVLDEKIDDEEEEVEVEEAVSTDIEEEATKEEVEVIESSDDDKENKKKKKGKKSNKKKKD